jgi:shikimate dehydrogenase
VRSFKQELVAVFGTPVAENPTQAMIEAAFHHHGLDWRYLTVEVAPGQLPAAIAGARAMGFRGFHCTIPHKLAVVPLLDRLGESAELIGAVNTVVVRDGVLVGENTDGRGFVDSLRRRLDPAGASVVVLGAGGAARAIAVELVLAGATELIIVNRTEETGRELAAHAGDVAGRFGHGVRSAFVAWTGELEPPACNVLVNATSIGLADPDACVPVELDGLPTGTLVADVIPNPPRTRFLREAGERGLPTLDGLEMLVEQGALSVTYWTGVEPDRAVMRRALAEVFAAEAGD